MDERRRQLAQRLREPGLVVAPGVFELISAKIAEHVWLEELIEVAESEGSCELYGILKRPDEKFVTERAYDNPKFVEDIVRDIATRLNADERVRSYVVEAENFESIHNHSAYARIARDKDESTA